MERVAQLVEPAEVDHLPVGELWALSEQLQFVRENIVLEELEADFPLFPDARSRWTAFLHREQQVRGALTRSVGMVAEELRSGRLGADAFRRGWESLGFVPNADGGGTPADDYLDAVSQVARYTVGEPTPPSGMPNMASRAHRIADFLAVTSPSSSDVVIDIGSGSGKVALTVAASTRAQVRGVEYGESYVAAARRSCEFLGIANLTFVHADARVADLSAGTIFYLYYPFHGEVARTVVSRLGAMARTRPITVYAGGPSNGFGEHFLREAEAGAWRLSERRGEFGEVLVLRSAPG